MAYRHGLESQFRETCAGLTFSERNYGCRRATSRIWTNCDQTFSPEPGLLVCDDSPAPHWGVGGSLCKTRDPGLGSTTYRLPQRVPHAGLFLRRLVERRTIGTCELSIMFPLMIRSGQSTLDTCRLRGEWGVETPGSLFFVLLFTLSLSCANTRFEYILGNYWG